MTIIQYLSTDDIDTFICPFGFACHATPVQKHNKFYNKNRANAAAEASYDRARFLAV